MLTKITFGYLKHSEVIEVTQIGNTTLCHQLPKIKGFKENKKIKEVKTEPPEVEERGYLLKLFK